MMLITGAYNYLYAQAGQPGIHGEVLNEKHLAAEAATVLLLDAADSLIIKSTACDENGLFKFNTKPGKYLLLVTKIGYDQSLSGPYKLENGADITVPAINLVPSVPQLEEVSITAQRSYVEVKPGKIILNVQGSIAATGNSAFGILRQAPDVHEDNQGNLSIIGRQSALVTIDGRAINLTGENLMTFLESMPGSTIQRIELITNPSAKYEAASIINIITKKGVDMGTNGTLNTGAGYGKFAKGNAGIIFNNRTNKLNVFGNYNYVADHTFHTFTTNRLINYNGLSSNYEDNYYTTRQSYSNIFRLGADYSISSGQTLGFLVNGTVNKDVFAKSNNLKITDQSVLDSTITTNSNLNRGLTNMNYDINYIGKLDTLG
jgi:iron complex outermembrane receptor protein